MESAKYPSQMTEVELIDAIFDGGIIDYLGYDGQIEREASRIKTLLEELQRKIKDPSRNASIAAQTRAEDAEKAVAAVIPFFQKHISGNTLSNVRIGDLKDALRFAITQGQDDQRDALMSDEEKSAIDKDQCNDTTDYHDTDYPCGY